MIAVCGSNRCNQLNKSSNSIDIQGDDAIWPPVEIQFDPSIILSYSISFNHAILITRHGTIYGIGNNNYGSICGLLPLTYITDLRKFEIKNCKGEKFIPISAACGYQYTLYMVSSDLKSTPQLAFSTFTRKQGQPPLFLSLNGRYPISLFGGRSIYAAAIDNEGEVVLINSHREQMNDGSPLKSVGLPSNEKAASVAFGFNFLIALSLNGKVFQSPLGLFGGRLEFSSVVELCGVRIKQISGIESNILAVTNDGRVYGKGSVKYGLPKSSDYGDETDKFAELKALKGQKIKAAFAGTDHSLFLTKEGKVLACGKNDCGQLNISKGPSKDHYLLPVETEIKSCCSFCIAGESFSAFFVNCDTPPMNPNQTIESIAKVSPISIMSLIELKELDHSKKKLFVELTSDWLDNLTDKKLIGKGGQSQVYLVTKEGKNYALKELNRDAPDDQKERFLSEYEAICKFDHPNIIQAFGVFEGDSNHPPSILLEYCETNLSSSVNDLSDMQRITTVYEIVSAMKDVHMHNLIHRDLKPDNVLYDSSMHVKLIDFGIARTDDNSSKTVGVGSLKFMAPEILNESSDYNEKVDIYSFGVLLFFVLSNGKYPQISIAKVASGKKAPIPDCINEFSRNLIMSCWSTNPEERPSFAEILEQIERANFRIIDGIEKDIFNIKKFLSI